MELTKEQKQRINELWGWIGDRNKPKQFITLGGYAGTGKTTLVAVLRKEIYRVNKKARVAFVSYTGKAARVLEIKLRENVAVFKDDYVGTIHSLIYSPLTDDKEEIIGWDRKDELKYDLIIIDEASMLNRDIWRDLLSYKLPIVAVGDHGQLPPIEGKFNLLEKPDLELKEIHRQAKENPIIELSLAARHEGYIDPGQYSSTVMKYNMQNDMASSKMDEVLEGFNSETMLLCGFNKTRVRLNDYIRQFKEKYTPGPTTGDRVICLRNNHQKQIFNGMLGEVGHIESESEDYYFVEIMMDGEELYKGLIYKEQFGSTKSINFTKKRKSVTDIDLFDFGYAMTVHKAQGSQAKKVVVLEERSKHMDDDVWSRWLYTAVTRAESELYLFGD